MKIETCTVKRIGPDDMAGPSYLLLHERSAEPVAYETFHDAVKCAETLGFTLRFACSSNLYRISFFTRLHGLLEKEDRYNAQMPEHVGSGLAGGKLRADRGARGLEPVD